jgi:hypothetical protein
MAKLELAVVSLIVAMAYFSQALGFALPGKFDVVLEKVASRSPLKITFPFFNSKRNFV